MTARSIQYRSVHMSLNSQSISFLGEKWSEGSPTMYDTAIEGRAINNMAAAVGATYKGTSLVVKVSSFGATTFEARRHYSPGPAANFTCRLSARPTAPEMDFSAGPGLLDEHPMDGEIAYKQGGQPPPNNHPKPPQPRAHQFAKSKVLTHEKTKATPRAKSKKAKTGQTSSSSKQAPLPNSSRTDLYS